MIKNCGKKFNIIARSFHLSPTYIQPAAPTICSILFHGVIPRTCRTIAHRMVTALKYLTYQVIFEDTA